MHFPLWRGTFSSMTRPFALCALLYSVFAPPVFGAGARPFPDGELVSLEQAYDRAAKRGYA